jgi:hypothetical protein
MNIGLLSLAAAMIWVSGYVLGANSGHKAGHKKGMIDGNLEGRKQLAHERAVQDQARAESERRSREESQRTAAATVRDVETPTAAEVPEVLAQNSRAIQSLGAKRPKSRHR